MKRFALKISALLLLLSTAVILLAACGKVEFKVDFIVDDAVYATINTNGEEVIKMPNDPEKEGYLFDGWYWDKDSWEKPFTANSLLDAPLSSDMSVYAKFTLNTIDGVTFEDVETTYDGTEKTLTVSNLPNSASVTYDKANTYINAGQYTVTATVSQENHEDLHLTATLTIKKATYDMSGVVFVDKTVTYNGESYSITATNLPDGVSATYTNNGQTDAGEYTITAIFTGDSANYESIENKTATLTINKAAYDMSGISFVDNTVTYDGKTHALSITGTLPNGLTVDYENNGKINAGDYTVIAKFIDTTGNYENPTDKTATLTINKATYDMSKVVFADKTVTYNGNAYSIEVQNVPNGLSVSYVGNDKTDAGTYIIAAKFTDTTGNYENPADMTATLVINKATVTGITFTNKIFIYDTKTHALAIDGNLPACINVTYTNNDKVNANTYIVTASFEDTSGNYIVPETMSAKLIIEKATVTGIMFENKTFTYNGTKHSLEISGTLPDEVTVSYVNNGKINANSYNVTATFTCETGNYNIPDDMTAVLTIKKAVYDMSAVTFENKTVTYDGKVHALAVSDNLPDGVTVEYTNNNQINANQYIVTAIFTGDSINYYAIDDMQAMLTINKATYDMSKAQFVGGRFTYDGTPKSIYVTGEIPDGVTVEYTNNGEINAGTYTVTATFIGDTKNYNKIGDRSASLIIDKATYDMSGVSFKNQTFTYDTTAKNAFILGNLPDGVQVSYVGNSKTDVGTYIITAKFNGDSTNYYLIEDMTATLKINQAVPYIKEVSCNNTLNMYSAVELFADTDVEGTITLDKGQTLALGYKTYSWTFVPEDTHNYTNATGTVGLTVCALVSYINDGVLFDSQNIALNNSAYIPTGTPLRADSNGYRYTFSHWSIEKNGVEYNFTNAITDNLNLYAVYSREEIIYPVNYYDTKGVEHNNITTYTVSTQYTLSDIEKEHYIFNGWMDEDGNPITKIVKGTFGALNIYATWTAIEYTITYDLGYRGAVNGNNATTYNVEDTFSFENAIYDEYHTFIGWYLEENYVNEKSSISVGESGAITLYAKWDFSGTYVSTISELQNMAYNMAGIYELKNDIDLTNASWTPIGDNTNQFNGYFNGGEFSVLGKLIFGVTGSNSVIKNVNSDKYIVNTNGGIITYCNAKGITPYNAGTITYCYSNGYVTYGEKGKGSYYVGGMVAYNTGNISYCYADASFSEDTYSSAYKGGGYSAEGYFGGLVGYSSGLISHSYSNCNITITGEARSSYDSYYHLTYGSNCSITVGGICATGTINYCYSVGSISATCTRQTAQGSAAAKVYGLAPTTNSCFSTCNISCSGATSTSVYCAREKTNTYYSGNYTCSIVPATSAYNLTSRTFIKNTLGWDESIWCLQDGQYPKLWFELE